MESKHYIQIIICALLTLIASVLGVYYYQTYIAPESFMIGTAKYDDYKQLQLKDYLNDDDVIFSQNINDVSFSSKDGISTYEYNFDHKEFDGIENDYLIYVNNYMINNIVKNAGTIGGVYNLNYYDIEKQVLCSSAININFSFYSLQSKLKVTLNSSELGYLINYFKTDNFIITLTENPYSMMNKDGEVDEKIKEIITLTNQVNVLNGEITVLNNQINQHLQDIADLTQSNEDKTAEIERIQAELSASQTQVANLTSELQSANSEISRLEAENIEIIAENTDLKALIENQKTTIAQLEQNVSDLQYQVSYYEQLLEEYQNIEKLSVSFKVDSQAVNVQLVNSGEFAEIPENPTKEHYTFKGWSVDGATIVDVLTYSIVEDVTFIAVFEELETHTVSFTVGEETTSYTVYEDETLQVPTNPSREGCEFYGWSIDGYNTVNIQTTNISKDINYIALFGYYEETYAFCNLVGNGNIYNVNLKDKITNIKGYYSIDLSKSNIPISVFNSAVGKVNGNDYTAFTLNDLTVGKVYTISSDVYQIPEFGNSGSMTIKIDLDGTVTIDLNDFTTASSQNNVGISVSSNATLYVITK